MPPTADDAFALLDFAEGLHAADSTDALGRVCREGLQRHVGFDICDVAVVECGDPADELYLPTPGGYDPGMLEEMVVRCLEHPRVHAAFAADDRRTWRISDIMTLTEWRASTFYAIGNRRHKQDYEILTMLPGRVASGVGGVAMSRSGRDYTPATGNSSNGFAAASGWPCTGCKSRSGGWRWSIRRRAWRSCCSPARSPR